MKYLIIFTLLIQLLNAAPAFPGKRTFVQPDGTKVVYQLQGDEYMRWLESEDGEVLLSNEKNKRLEYAIVKDGNLKASGVAFSKKPQGEKASQIKKVSKKELIELYTKKHQHMKSRHPSH